MKIPAYRKVPFELIDPLELFDVLALIAMSVPTGIISYFPMPTFVAPIQVPTHYYCPAPTDGIEGLQLIGAQLVSVQKLPAIFVKYGSYIQRMPFVDRFHGWSNGLFTEGSIAARCR